MGWLCLCACVRAQGGGYKTSAYRAVDGRRVEGVAVAVLLEDVRRGRLQQLAEDVLVRRLAHLPRRDDGVTHA